MYVNYAESQRWKVELVSVNENGIGGFKEVVAMITGERRLFKLKYEAAYTVYSVCRKLRAADVSILPLQRYAVMPGGRGCRYPD